MATTESFRDARTLPSVDVLPENDCVAKLLAEDLPAGQDIFYRVTFSDLADVNAVSEPMTAASAPRPPACAMSPSPGPATRQGRVGASTPIAAA